MTKSPREIWARAAAANIARQEQMNIDNMSDKVYLPQRGQREQREQQKRTSSDEALELEEDVKLAREAVMWLVRRVGYLPTSRSFLNLGLSLLSAMRSPTVHHLLGATWTFKVRYGQSVVAEALAGVAEEDLAAYVEAIVRGNIEVLRCKDIPVLLPDASGLRTNKGAVIIRNALKRECDMSDEAQEKEWAKERLEDEMYRAYLARKEAALAGLTTARVGSARASRSRSLPPNQTRDRRTASPRRSRSLSIGRQVVDNNDESPAPTSLDYKDYDEIFIAAPPESSPALRTRPSSKNKMTEQASEDSSNGQEGDTSNVKTSPPLSSSIEEGDTSDVTISPPLSSVIEEGDTSDVKISPLLSSFIEEGDTSDVKISPPLSSSIEEGDTPGGKPFTPLSSYGEEPSPPGVKISPHLSSSDDEAAPTPPLTPSLISPPVCSNQPPPLLDLLTPTPPPTPPRTSSLNHLGEMFHPQLNKLCVVFVVNDILCSERVLNDRRKAKKVLTELENGCMCAETMEWVTRGLRSPRSKREMAQRLHGLEFVGPQWGAPKYKTGRGVRHLLKGVAGKHEAGARFVVCASSSRSHNRANNVNIITGVLCDSSEALVPDTADGPQPVMDGEVPGLEDWVNTCGNLDDGCRLWAWIY